MIISAEKVGRFIEENKKNEISVENAIITAALTGETSILWTKELSKTAIYDIISSGYTIKEKVRKGRLCYDISWADSIENNITEEDDDWSE